MGIFGKASSVDSNINNSSNSSQSRNRRTSSSAVSTNSNVPVSIVPAPPQGGSYLKSTPNSGNISASGVFGRQQSWSDQLADSALLKGSNTTSNPKIPGYPSVIPVSHNANILYGNNNSSNSSNSTNDVKFVHSTMEILENQIKREEAPKKKRTRTSTEQLRILQKAFQTDPMPNSSARTALSKKLGMSTRAVQVWFQNRRAKEKLDAKRNVMGLSGSSSFTYVKGNSDDEDGEGSVAGEDDGEYNFDEEGSVTGSLNGTESNITGNKVSNEFLNSIKANGMMGRMAFGDSNNISMSSNPMKSQRSSSTPNGFFLGSTITANGNNSFFSSSSTLNTYNQINNRFPSAKPGLSGGPFNNPLCHLFPGETFISDVNEASVDQLYQDLGGAGSIPSPIDDTCTVLSGGGGNGSGSNNHHNNMNISAFMTSSSGLSNQLQSNSSSSSAAGPGSFFTFGDPFYGGGIIDRTPSVSPVGFGPRSNFYPIGAAFDFINMSSNSSTSPNSELSNDPVFPSINVCKGPSGGNVYLTSSIGSSINTNPSSFSASASGNNRRSFSLPEAHGNLTIQQMQQLENFGLQVFPSPLLSSINEEDPSTITTGPQKDENFIFNPNNSFKTADSSPVTSTNSNDFLIPFSDFLEGEVIR